MVSPKTLKMQDVNIAGFRNLQRYGGTPASVHSTGLQRQAA